MNKQIKHGKYCKDYQNYCKVCHKKISPMSTHCTKHKKTAIGWKQTKKTKLHLSKIKKEFYLTHKNPLLGRKCTQAQRKRMSKAQKKFFSSHPEHLKKLSNLRKKLFSTLTKQEIKRRFYSYIMVNHHIDLNRNNNKKDNLWKIHKNLHRKLHLRAYDYLVKKGLIKNYINWFKRKYKKQFKDLKLNKGEK